MLGSGLLGLALLYCLLTFNGFSLSQILIALYVNLLPGLFLVVFFTAGQMLELIRIFSQPA